MMMFKVYDEGENLMKMIILMNMALKVMMNILILIKMMKDIGLIGQKTIDTLMGTIQIIAKIIGHIY